MIRCPIGSVSFPSSFRNKPPAIRVLGTVLVSTTLIHGVHLMEAKYCALDFISSSVIAFAIWIMIFVFAFLVSAPTR